MKKLFVLYFILTAMIFPMKKIMVIQSYSLAYAWDQGYVGALKDVINKENKLYFFEMNTKIVPAKEHQKMADKAFGEYQKIKPDMVVLGDDAALKYLGPKFAELGVPIVYLGINNNPRNYFKKYPKNITGVLERPLLKRSLAFIKEMMPKSKKVLVMFDTGLTSQVIKDEEFYSRNTISIEGMKVDLVMVKTYDEWKKIVKGTKGTYDFIIMGLYQTIKDENGKHVDMNEIAKWTNKNTPVPAFGFWDFSVGKDKSIGGYVLSAKDIGTRAGTIVNRALKGEKLEKIGPIYESEGVFLFSKSQLEKWNLTLSDRILLKKIEYTE